MEKKRINIITPFSHPVFMRQLPKNKFGDFEFHENSKVDLDWDFVIVYEGLKREISLRAKKGGLVFISGEPPVSRNYSTKFIQQFDFVISSHSNIKHNHHIKEQQALPWHLGANNKTMDFKYNFEDFEKMIPGEKQKNISFITSNKKMMPGHIERMKFFEAAQKRYGSLIDYYGKGINPVDDKADALLNYKFNICIENSNINDYWSEKLADPFLAFAMPIYSGCTNIEKYFDSKSLFIVDIKNLDSTYRCIDTILDNPDSIYTKNINYLKESRNRILYKYNIFNVILDVYHKFEKHLSNNYILSLIKPSEFFVDHKIKMYQLRLKRLIYRLSNY